MNTRYAPDFCPAFSKKNQFLQRQKATYPLDFHDLIAFAIHLLENDPEVREKWQDRLDYIMVDEFQDSSAVEMRLVDILSD